VIARWSIQGTGFEDSHLSRTPVQVRKHDGFAHGGRAIAAGERAAQGRRKDERPSSHL